MDQLHLLEVILDNLPDGVYVLDDRGNYIFVNSAYVQALNMPKDVLLHYNVHDFLNTGQIDICVSDIVYREKRQVVMFQDVLDNAPEVNLYMEYSNKTCLDNVLRLFRDLNLKVLNMEITRSTETETHNACALFTLRLNKRCRVEQLIPKMNATEGVVSVEEL